MKKNAEDRVWRDRLAELQRPKQGHDCKRQGHGRICQQKVEVMYEGDQPVAGHAVDAMERSAATLNRAWPPAMLAE